MRDPGNGVESAKQRGNNLIKTLNQVQTDKVIRRRVPDQSLRCSESSD